MSENIVFDELEPDPRFADKVAAYLLSYNQLVDSDASVVKDAITEAGDGVDYDTAGYIVNRAAFDHRVWRGPALARVGATALRNS